MSTGEDTIKVIAAQNWKVGDEIVVASTDYDSKQAETFRIIQVVDTRTFKLNATARYNHWGELDKLIDERAEVSSLTRSIVIQGKIDTIFTDTFFYEIDINYKSFLIKLFNFYCRR